jgi:hypothetical protein
VGASDAIHDFVQRPARDFQEAREFPVRGAAKTLSDVAAHRIDRVFELALALEIVLTRRPARDFVNLDS